MCGEPATFFYLKWWCGHTRYLKGVCAKVKHTKGLK